MLQEGTRYNAFLGIQFSYDNSKGMNCVTLITELLRNYVDSSFDYKETKVHNFELLRNNPFIIQGYLDNYFKKLNTDNNINCNELLLGDILLFKFHKMPTHLGFYIGDMKFITTSDNDKSKIADLNRKAWQRQLVGVYRWQ